MFWVSLVVGALAGIHTSSVSAQGSTICTPPFHCTDVGMGSTPLVAH
jgi:hypothetical protein